MSTENRIQIDTFRIYQPIGEYFIGTTTAQELLKICSFDYRRMAYGAGYTEFLGIQRRLSPKRVEEISRYCMTSDACFPTSIVISVPGKCVVQEKLCDGLVTRLIISEYIDQDSAYLSVKLDEIASIIDGQHRLKGIEESVGSDMEISVSIFVGVDEATDASIFSTVNLAQTKVNKSLVYDLFSLSKSRSPERTCHEIVVALDRDPDSPFRGRIKRLGTATDGRFGETLSQATLVQGLLPLITSDVLADRDRGRRFGFWEAIEGPELSRRIFYPFFQRDEDSKILAIVRNYWNAVSETWPQAWNSSGSGVMLNRTNGYNAFMRFLRPAYLHFTAPGGIVSRSEFYELLKEVKLSDADFNVRNFVPGTSGAKELYDILMRDTRVVRGAGSAG